MIDEPMGQGAGAGTLREGKEARLFADVRRGMAQPQKELSSKYFYDTRGSELFEDITRLPEYYLTGTERTLLADQVAPWVTQSKPATLVELYIATSPCDRGDCPWRVYRTILRGCPHLQC